MGGDKVTIIVRPGSAEQAKLQVTDEELEYLIFSRQLRGSWVEDM
jgi:hypothetical protein